MDEIAKDIKALRRRIKEKFFESAFEMELVPEEKEEAPARPQPAPEAEEPGGIARFNVTKLYVAPNEVPPNQPVNVWADVSNVGNEYGYYDVILFINGEKEGGQRIYLHPGENRRVSFQVSRPTPGTWCGSYSEGAARRTGRCCPAAEMRCSTVATRAQPCGC